MGSFLDLSGRQFGTYTVLRDSGTRSSGSVLWLCSCSCGAHRIISQKRLCDGHFPACPSCPRENTIVDSFALGILWATSTRSGYGLVVRNEDSFFASYIASITGNKVFQLTHPRLGTVLHCVKAGIELSNLAKDYGFSGRDDSSRVFPAMPDPPAFACAYVQCHSTLDIAIRTSRSGRSFQAPRLRIYGAAALLSGICSVFHDALSCGLKTPQAYKGTYILYYQSASEVLHIVDTVASHQHCSPVFQATVDSFFSAYRKTV